MRDLCTRMLAMLGCCLSMATVAYAAAPDFPVRPIRLLVSGLGGTGDFAARLIGPHLVDDVMAAATVARLAGVSAAEVTAAVEGFTGLEHAMELVADIGGVRFVNDSKATNVEAARRAIESFDRGVVAIVGGRFKGGDLRLLRAPLAARAKAVVAIGEARPLVRDALSDVVDVREASSLEEAVGIGYDLAKPEGVVLLAPACASFDMFRDYAERGRRFKEEVERLRRQSL